MSKKDKDSITSESPFWTTYRNDEDTYTTVSLHPSVGQRLEVNIQPDVSDDHAAISFTARKGSYSDGTNVSAQATVHLSKAQYEALRQAILNQGDSTESRSTVLSDTREA